MTGDNEFLGDYIKEVSYAYDVYVGKKVLFIEAIEKVLNLECYPFDVDVYVHDGEVKIIVATKLTEEFIKNIENLFGLKFYKYSLFKTYVDFNGKLKTEKETHHYIFKYNFKY